MILEDYFFVNNFLGGVDILKILKETFRLEKVLFKVTYRWLYI
jgi:hypothetical protein